MEKGLSAIESPVDDTEEAKLPFVIFLSAEALV
jgi:hypothetical protein